MNELDKIISVIMESYNEINKKWQQTDKYQSLNMKKIKVDDVYNDESLLAYVFKYREFINDNVSTVVNSIQKCNFENIVNSRVKAYNSIQYKIQNYESNHENGKITLKKCLNDIFGLRIIFEEPIDYFKIKKFTDENYPQLKCIESSRGDYYATHIYFGNSDNHNFQWELQIWDKMHEKNNLDSHAKYKQNYTLWERENNL